jgi:ABC-type sugar transport system ATPase subunit
VGRFGDVVRELVRVPAELRVAAIGIDRAEDSVCRRIGNLVRERMTGERCVIRLDVDLVLIGEPELIIVDEPTAGLDPEERNRFLNLLAGIGENVVVILSTHIVDDVADLCPRMAVLAGGKLRLEGAPHDLIASTQGRVWQRTVPHTELAEMQAAHEVISHRFFAGEIVVHVLADSQPEGFMPVSGGLEDVYFATLAETRRAPAAAQAA